MTSRNEEQKETMAKEGSEAKEKEEKTYRFNFTQPGLKLTDQS